MMIRLIFLLRITSTCAEDKWVSAWAFQQEADSTQEENERAALQGAKTSSTLTSVCGPGQGQTATGCSYCVAGMFSAGFVAASCNACRPGMFQNSVGQSKCLHCPDAYFSKHSGSQFADSCIRCQPGLTTVALPQSITANTFCILTSGVNGFVLRRLKKCRRGSHAELTAKGGVLCKPCAAGRYGMPGPQRNRGGLRNICIRCPEGKYSPRKGLSKCVTCNAGSHSAQSRERCDPGATVIPKISGQERGFYVTMFFKTCPAGKFKLHRNGGTANTISFCRSCPAGKYRGATQTTQTAASGSTTDGPAADRRSTEVRERCARCPVGYYQMRRGGQRCSACSAGSFSPGITLAERRSCSLCPHGYFAQRAQGVCTACPAGYDQLGARPHGQLARQAPCVECRSGMFKASVSSSLAATRCVLCGAGKYQPLRAQPSCIACIGGQARAWSHKRRTCTNCVVCQAGQYQPTGGAASCISCPGGKYTLVDKLSKRLTYCKYCPAGKFSVLGSCILCPRGKHQTAPGQGACSSNSGKDADEALAADRQVRAAEAEAEAILRGGAAGALAARPTQPLGSVEFVLPSGP
jgi:hypothetical protein